MAAKPYNLKSFFDVKKIFYQDKNLLEFAHRIWPYTYNQ